MRKPVHEPSKPVKRLGVVTGVAATIGWISFVLNHSYDQGAYPGLYWFLVIGIPICFGLGVAFIAGIDRIVGKLRQSSTA